MPVARQKNCSVPLFGGVLSYEDSGLRVHLLLIIVLLAGCNIANSWSEVGERELRQRNHGCQMASTLTPAEIQVCKNIRRECDRRAKLEIYVC